CTLIYTLSLPCGRRTAVAGHRRRGGSSIRTRVTTTCAHRPHDALPAARAGRASSADRTKRPEQRQHAGSAAVLALELRHRGQLIPAAVAAAPSGPEPLHRLSTAPNAPIAPPAPVAHRPPTAPGASPATA